MSIYDRDFSKINAKAVVAGSAVQTENVLQSALDEIARLNVERESLRVRNTRLEESLKIGWGDEREGIAKWMSANGLATGHGDTIDDLLSEAAWQIKELRARALKDGEE